MLLSVEPAGVDDPCLIVAKLEELGVGVRTAAAALAEAVIDIGDHNVSSLDRRCNPAPPLRAAASNHYLTKFPKINIIAAYFFEIFTFQRIGPCS